MKPVTASVKVNVTIAVSPTFSAVSATTMVAVGTLGIDRVVAELVVPVPALPARSLTPVLSSVITLVVR